MSSFVKIRNYCYMISIAFYLLTLLVPNPNWFPSVLSSLAILCLLVSVPVSSNIVKWISIVFLAGGSTLVIVHGTSLTAYFHLFGKMFDLLTLFTVIPFMAIPIQVGDYSPSILKAVFKVANNEKKLHRSVTVIAYGLASIMNLAALPMTYFSIRDSLKNFGVANEDRFLCTSITRGYAMPLVWSPVAAVLGAVVQVTKTSWSWILPFSLFLSFAGILLTFLLSPKASKTTASIGLKEIIPPDRNSKNPALKIAQMGLGIVLFAILMTLLQQIASMSIVSAVTLLSIPFSAAWALLLRKGRPFVTETKKQLSQLSKMKDQFAVFLSAGFFVNVLQAANVAPNIDRFLLRVSHSIGTEWFLILIPLIPVLLSLVGMHPVVSIALLGQSLDPSLLGIRPEWVAVAYVGGGVTTFLLSPFNATLTVMGGVLKRTPFELAKWNAPFCFLYLAFTMALVGVLNGLMP